MPVRYDSKGVVAMGLTVVGIVSVLSVIGGAEDAATSQPLWTTIAKAPAVELEAVDYAAYADLKTPPLSPEQAMEKFQLEDGFRIEVVAHEPMVVDPVAMDIDPDGRLWVVNMPAYNSGPVRDMLENTGERTEERERALRESVPDEPLGSIVVLEDTTRDGRMDTRRVFYHGLRMPRAIKVLRDGVLVAESPNLGVEIDDSPNLWFIRDTNGDGVGDTRERVLEDYDTTGSPQGGLNALMWGMDNWIHSSRAPSLRRVGGQWHTRPFQRLGGWAMTQDDFGRLYAASNSWPLEAHLVPHGYGERHPRARISSGKSVRIAPNGPVWPAHAPGVNRGYRVGDVTREDGTIKRGAGIASTVIYRGGQFGDEYRGDAFTPVTAGNLISRLILDADPAEIEAEADFAYEQREFLTSTDERFRPVNMYNAPDGSIYVVDMYRGLYDYILWVTEFLGEHALEHELYEPTGKFGRIYRIVREDRAIDYDTPRMSQQQPAELVQHLTSPHAQVRDLAQQVLVQQSPDEAVAPLEQLARDGSFEAYTRMHALWTLDGFDRAVYPQPRLTALAVQALDDPHPRARAAAVRILEPAIAQNLPHVLGELQRLAERETAPAVELQLLASLGESFDDTASHTLAAILDKHVESAYFREMALTGVYRREDRIASILREEHGWSDDRGGHYASVLASLAELQEDAPETNLDDLTDAQRELFQRGSRQYGICMACHGPNGQGIDGLGPAMAESEWVLGDPEALVRIVLQGIDGAAAERGESMPNVMPGHRFISDEDLAAILLYIRRSWGNEAAPIDPEQIAAIREQTADREASWSPGELREELD